MRKPLSFRFNKMRKWFLIVPVALIALLIVWTLPSSVSSQNESSANEKGRANQNYDIRTDNSEAALQMAEQKRQKIRSIKKRPACRS